MTTPRDQDDHEVYEEDEEELEELNRSTATSTFLEKRWWRWLAVGIAALVLASFALPVVLPLFQNGSDTVQPGQGMQVPDFTLESPNRGTITLSDQVAANDYVVLVFYRTYH